MIIRFANPEDITWLHNHDHHIAEEELRTLIQLQRVLIAETDGIPVGWLRWNLFWDNTPFMNMLYMLESHRRVGIGTLLVQHWEHLMDSQGYSAVMTSTLSNEEAQHFYRKHGYRDSGALMLPGEALEIIFYKELKP